MVLLFHGQVGWMHGGYFGVSMFFTLSGFLITSLLLREFDVERPRRTEGVLRQAAATADAGKPAVPVGRVRPGGVRRVGRRRPPASRRCRVPCSRWPTGSQLAAGESYTDLQSRNAGIISPLDHYWSLAIEEQFYWVWPVGFWGLATLARRRGWGLATVIGALTVVFAVAAPVIAVVWGRDAADRATPARMAEILIGAWIAVALASGKIRPHAWMAPIGASAARHWRWCSQRPAGRRITAGSRHWQW